MNKFDEEIYLLGMALIMSSDYNMFKGLTFDEMLMAMDQKIMNITLGITFEIRELLEQGYSEDEIIKLIQNIKFDVEDNINDKEAEYIKKDDKKTLKLIMNNKKEENDKYE